MKKKNYSTEQIAFLKGYNKGKSESNFVLGIIRLILNLGKEWSADKGDYGYTEPEQYVLAKLKEMYESR